MLNRRSKIRGFKNTTHAAPLRVAQSKELIDYKKINASLRKDESGKILLEENIKGEWSLFIPVKDHN